MQQREVNYVAALRKVPDFYTLVISIDTGAFNDLASVIGSQLTQTFARNTMKDSWRES